MSRLQQELGAMETIARVLMPLSEAERRRVLLWVVEVYGIQQPRKKHPLDP